MLRRAVIATAPLLVVGLLQATPMSASSAAGPAGTGRAGRTADSGGVSGGVSGAVDVRLPTGQHVAVSRIDGRTAVRFPTAAGERREPMTVLTAHGHTYVIPARVSAAAGTSGLAAYDVSARAFGQPAVSLNQSTAGAQAGPATDPFTVTVHGVTRAGQDASGDIVLLMNVDDSDTFIDTTAFDDGTASFVVPPGHYAVESFIATLKHGAPSYTLVTNPEFLVDGDVTVSLDARTGNRISVTTPRPSTPVDAEVNLQRDPATGPSVVDSFVTFDNTPVYAAPTKPVKVGRLFFYQTQRRGARDGSIAKFLYDLAFATKRLIPADLRTDVTDADLATVSASYASVLPDRAEQEYRLSAFPWQAIVSGGIQSLVAPTSRTEYVMAGARLRWFQEVDLDPDGGNGRTIGTVDLFKPAEQTRHVWDQQPMGSGVQQQRDVTQSCPICRTADDSLSVAVFPHVDKARDFMLADSTIAEQLVLYQDGTEVGRSSTGFASFPLSPDPASYRLQYDVDHEASYWPTSTHVSTTWSFRSQEGGTQVPPDWTCGGKGALPDDCFLQHILLVSWATGAGLDGVVPAGTTAHVRVTVAPQRGLPADPITRLTAKVSYDAGATWQQVKATATADPKVWRLTYEQPGLNETDGFASLRVTAHASAGRASVSQTVIHAYPLAALG